MIAPVENVMCFHVTFTVNVGNLTFPVIAVFYRFHPAHVPTAHVLFLIWLTEL